MLTEKLLKTWPTFTPLSAKLGPWVFPETNMTYWAGCGAIVTCELCGAGAIGWCSPCAPVFTNLLNSTGVETLVHSCHTENPQPVHFSLCFLIQTKLWLGESTGVVPIQLHFLYAHLHNQKLRALKGRRRGGRRGGRRGESWCNKRRKEPAKDEDTSAPLPLRYEAGERQVVFLCYHDNRPRGHCHIQGMTYLCWQRTQTVQVVCTAVIFWYEFLFSVYVLLC